MHSIYRLCLAEKQMICLWDGYNDKDSTFLPIMGNKKKNIIGPTSQVHLLEYVIIGELVKLHQREQILITDIF